MDRSPTADAGTATGAVCLGLAPVPESAVCEGDLILRKWKAALNSFGVVWSPAQEEIIHEARLAVMPNMYGAEWPTHRQRVYEREGADPAQVWWKLRMLSCPRRGGKTTMVAALACAHALVKPGSRQIIIVENPEAGSAVLRLCQEMFSADPDRIERVVVSDPETLCLQGPPGGMDPDIRVIRAVSAQGDNHPGIEKAFPGTDVTYHERPTSVRVVCSAVISSRVVPR